MVLRNGKHQVRLAAAKADALLRRSSSFNLRQPKRKNLPLLWIHGKLDPLIPVASTCPVIEFLHGSSFEEHTYPGAQHEVFNGINRAEVLADVVSFVQRMLFQK